MGGAFLDESGGAVHSGHWFVPFLLAMALPAYLISSFDATGNASEGTKSAALEAPMASVPANTRWTGQPPSMVRQGNRVAPDI
ncbi:hypothetical protein [Nocardia gamkensis]|uniref:hypothetical protein n=1 Tax=Nocardia gamkensis TaxID=352869 RepID=UPI0007A40466|nr:hypothetical protein [Nocardia gamkensis]NQE72686.1 hypothetical protein [Nocardia gamkensis]